MTHVRLLARGALAVFTIFAGVLAIAEPRHVYLTYSDDPVTTIDVNVILNEQEGDVHIYYDTESRDGDKEGYANHVVATHIPTLMVMADERALYVAKLTGLDPGQKYYFIAGEEEEYGLSGERAFRTLPGGDKPIRFINGGDMGIDDYAKPLLALAGDENPHFGIVGGDFAYANGLLGAYAIWDRWLSNWDEHMVTDDGCMVPIVGTTGNHETNDAIDPRKDIRAPWYMGLFGRQGDDVFYSRQFGDNMVLFGLDTGHLVPYDGPQLEWLKQEMAKFENVKYKFAAYHIPLYPAHREYDGRASEAGRELWGPVFDEFGLTVGLEHHDHVFKRSKPLKGNKVVEDGTIYIGDGCFGRGPRTVYENPRWYNEKEGANAHFWVVDVNNDAIHLRAIEHDGTELDNFTIPAK